MIQWSEELQCLTDYMGVPCSRTQALEYREALRKHLKHSAADLAGIALKVLKEKHPNMAEQLPFCPEDFE